MNCTERANVEASAQRSDFSEAFYPWIENAAGHPSIPEGGAPASDKVVGVRTATPLFRDEKSANTPELFSYGSGREDWRYSANSYIDVSARATQILKPPVLRSPVLPVTADPDPWTKFVGGNKPASLQIPLETPQAPMKRSDLPERIWTARWHLILILNSLLLVAEACVLYAYLGR